MAGKVRTVEQRLGRDVFEEPDQMLAELDDFLA
jgi:hypothetical protein